MVYKYQEQVRIRAKQYIADLKSGGFSAELQENSFRDYCVKVSISSGTQSIGNAIIYYSPKKDSYRLGTHELKDQSYVTALEDTWFATDEIDKKQSETPSGWQIYTDGSFFAGNIGLGAVILREGEVKHEISAPVDDPDPELLKMQQVPGELYAVLSALNWLVENYVESVKIFYDYKGVEKWATGEWRAKNRYTQAYVRFIDECSIDIKWEKVTSHTGKRWNERADQLARLGASQGKQPNGDEVDLISEVDDVAKTFTDYLNSNGVDASYQGILNEQFARIIVPGKPQQNYLDIYNTKKKRLSPTWHDFRNDSLRKKAQALWNEFTLDGSKTDTLTKSDDPLGLIDYYYEILEPYKDYEFDFISLAKELQHLSHSLGMEDIEIDKSRYDFSELEEIYIRLKGQING